MRLIAVILGLTAATAAAGQQLDSTLYASLHYRFIGPPGNRVSAVTGEPGNPMVAYVGAASGGVWKTEDGGVRWRPVFDSMSAQAIGALAVAPSAHNEVWAGTGETFIIRSMTAIGDGIYKSTDGGDSWTRMGLEATGRIGRIVIHPTDGGTVYACALGHAFGPQQERGVYKTTDGGHTWSRVLFVDPNTGCADLAMDPHDPQTLIAGMWQVDIKPWNLNSGGPGSGIWITHDGGAHWERLAGHGLPAADHPVGKIAVAFAPSDPDRVYALIEDADPGFYRSNDGGHSWRLMSHNHTMAERAPYYVRFAVDPDDANRVYFVSVRFSMSRDGGATLADDPPRGGGDNHDIWIDPTDGDRFMVGHDGGASITLNHGQSFERVVLPIAQMYHAHPDAKIPYDVYGNRQDDGSYVMPSNSRGGFGISAGLWHSVGGCESGFGVPDTVTNTTVWSGCYDAGLEIYDATTGHARNVRVWPEAAYGWTPKDLKYRWNWTFPIEISPHDHNRVYVGSQFVHVTTNGGASWQVISPDLTRNDTTHQGNSGGVGVDNLMTFDGATLLIIAESPVTAGLIWTGSNDGLVQLTRDNGSTWTNVTANIPRLGPWGKVVAIRPSHFDAATAYVAVERHEMADFEPYLFKTTDYGAHWRRIDAGLPRGPLGFLHVVTEDPVRPGMLYVGTENSLWFSRDDGAHWQPLQLDLPHAPVSWIEVQPRFNDLVVATYGRGVYILDDVSSLRAMDPGTFGAAHLFRPREAWRFRSVHSTDGDAGFVNGENPRYGADINYYLRDSSATVRLRVVAPSGETVRTLEGSHRAGLNRVWWDLRYPSVQRSRLRTPPPGAPWVPLGDDGTRRIVPWDLDLSQRGPLALPGTYTVELSVGDSTWRDSLVVRKDPNTRGTADDVHAQWMLGMALRNELDTLVGAVNSMEWVRKQLSDLTAQLRSDSTRRADSTIRDILHGARELEDQIVAVEGQLFDIHMTGAREDAFRHGTRLYGRYSALLSDVAESGADYAPTSQQQEVHTVLQQRLQSAFREWDGLLQGAIARFKARLRTANLPDVLAGGP